MRAWTPDDGEVDEAPKLRAWTPDDGETDIPPEVLAADRRGEPFHFTLDDGQLTRQPADPRQERARARLDALDIPGPAPEAPVRGRTQDPGLSSLDEDGGAAFGYHPQIERGVPAGPQQPVAKRTGSVIDTITPREPAVEDFGAPVTAQTFGEVERAMKGMTPDERTQAAEREDWRGAVAKKVLERWGEPMPTMKKVMGRREDIYEQDIREGASPETAARRARLNAGAPEGLDATGSARVSDFDFDTAARYKDASALERGLVKGKEMLSQSGGGILKFAAEATGNDATGIDEALTQIKGRVDAIGENQSSNALARHFENAVSSMVLNVPGLAYGAVTGAAVVPLLVMSAQVFGQEYDDGRRQKLSHGEAAARAAVFGVAEAIGERVGMPTFLKAFRAATKGVPAEELMGLLAKHTAREIPGELLTTTLQFSADKFAPMGLTPEAGLKDYLAQMGDTLVQTVMQAGTMTGAAIAPNAFALHQQGRAQGRADVAEASAMEKWATQGLVRRPETPAAGLADVVADPVSREAAIDQWRKEGFAKQKEAMGESAAAAAPAQPVDKVPDLQGSPVDKTPEMQDPAAAAAPKIINFTGMGEAMSENLYLGLFDSLKAGKDTLSGVKDPVLAKARAAFEAGIIKSPEDLKKYVADGYPEVGAAAPEGLSDLPPIDEGRAIEKMQEQADSYAQAVKADGMREVTQTRGALEDAEKGDRVVGYVKDGPAAIRAAAQITRETGEKHVADQIGGKWVVMKATPVDAAAHEAATSPLNDLPEPTEAQKQAGNYKVGRVKVHGLDVAIENPKGSERSGKDADGEKWSVTMPAHYGYIKRTEGADGDHVDVYVGPNPEATEVYVIDQVDAKTGKFDEHKALVGFNSREEAEATYKAGFSDGKGAQRMGAVIPMSADEFKAWIKAGDTTKPLSKGVTDAPAVEVPALPASDDTGEPATGTAQAERVQPVGGDPAQEPTGQAEAGAVEPQEDEVVGALQALVDRFENPPAGKYVTERELLESVEGMDDAPPELLAAAAEYRQALDEDFNEHAGRGDTEPSEEAFMDALREAASGKKKAPTPVKSRFPVLDENGNRRIWKTEKQAALWLKNNPLQGASVQPAEGGFMVGPAGPKAPAKNPTAEAMKGHRELAKEIDEAIEKNVGHADLLPDFEGANFAAALEESGWTRGENGYWKRDGWKLFVRSQGELATPIAQWSREDGKHTGWGDAEKASADADKPAATAKDAATREQFEDAAFQATAVACPDCGVKPGVWCVRPSGHPAGSLHKARGQLADEVFIDLFGKAAEIDFDESANRWGVRAAPSGKFIAHATKEGRKADGDAQNQGETPKQDALKKKMAEKKVGEPVAPEVPKSQIAEEATGEWWKSLTPYGRQLAASAAGLKKQTGLVAWQHMMAKERVPLTRLRESGWSAEAAASEAKEPKAIETSFAKNKVFTADKVAAARARLKSKLGTLNSGIDPELLVDGMTIAGAYIESGVRSFKDYSKAMIADLGDAVKPYLLSFYEAVRAYPGIEKDGMSTPDEASAEHAGVLSSDPEASQTPAVGEAPKAKREKKPRKVSDGGMRLTQDWGVEAIDGYDGEGGESPTGNGVKRQFLAEAKKYLDLVGERLRESGFMPHTDRKGRPDKPVSVNPSGIATSGSASLTVTDGKANVYITIGASSLRGVVPGTKQGVAVMARVGPAGDDRYATKTANNWLETGLSAAELATWAEDRALLISGLETATKPEQTTPKEPENGQPVPAESVPATPAGADQGTGAVRRRRGKSVDARVAGKGQEPDRQGGLFGGPDGAGEARDGRPDGAGRADAPGPSRDSAGVRADDGAPGDVGNFEITDATGVGEGGLKKKYRDNIAAIKILRELDEQKRVATPDEREAIARYVGWGGLKAVFDPSSKGWAEEYAEVKSLLTAEEWTAARKSILNAHYTSPAVVSSMWDAIGRLGFTSGRVLEPSVGVGNFFGFMPKAMRGGAKLFGVELDHLTSRIVAALYPRAQIAKSTGFQDYQIPSGYFDLAVGNPPFGSEPIVDEDRSPYSGFSIHNYFFAKSIDKLREGGLLVMVVSHSFLDRMSPAARNWIAQRAELVSAARLPKTAFKENAGTEVVTDILVLRRVAERPVPNDSWLSTSTLTLETDKGESAKAEVNDYFLANPRNVLGRQTAAGSMYRANEYTVEPTGDLAEQLGEWVKGLPEGIYTPVERGAEMEASDVVLPDGVKIGTFYVGDNGAVMQRTPDALGKQQAVAWVAPSDMSEKRMRGMIQLREALRGQMRLEKDSLATEAGIEGGRKALNALYDSFVREFGYVNSQVNRRVFLDDPEAPLLQALEVDYDKGLGKTSKAVKEDGAEPRAPFAKKADILNRRVLFPPNENLVISSAKDALIASLNYKGRMDLPYMEGIYSKSAEEIIAELGDVVYIDPQDGPVTADEYLSGDVKTKLDEAKAAAQGDSKFERNVSALEKIIPADLMPSQIFASPGAAWIARKDYEEFLKEITGHATAAVHYIAPTATWTVHAEGAPDAGKESAEFGTSRIGATKLFTELLNGKAPIIYDRLPDDTRVVNKEATEAANERQNKIRDKWNSWIWADADRSTRLAGVYNEKHNRVVERKFDGGHMTFPGMTPAIQLRKSQKDSAWRGLQDRQMLMDHVVGAGKTFAGAALAMEFRRLAVARKPLFVVPNHLTLAWRQEFYRLYPTANVLVALPEDFSKDNRRRLFSKIATGDWDSVVIGHSSVKKIGLPKATEKRIVEEQISELAAGIEELKKERGDRNLIRDMEKIKANLDAKMKARQQKVGTRDDVVDFDELGVDAVFIDEFHEFKNLFFTTQKQRVAGMGNPEGSAKAFDLFVKIRWLFETFGEKAPLITMTGTPVSNSLAEMFTVQRYMQYAQLKNHGLQLFDAWAKMFGDDQNVYEVSPSGVGYRVSQRFARFKNLPALMGMYRGFADVITMDDLKQQAIDEGKVFPVPKIAGGRPQIIVAKKSPMQNFYIGEPELARTADGDIEFEAPVEKAPEIEQTKDGRWMARTDRWSASFATEEEAREGYATKALTPVIGFNKPSLLDQFANLRDLTRQTKGRINALSLTNLANKVALDYRLIEPGAADFPGSKVNESIKHMLRIYKKWDADRGTQLVFCDLSVPLSARKRMSAKEARVYIRDDQGALTHARGTVNSVEGFEGFPFYLIPRGKGGTKTIDMHDPVSGVRIRTGLATREEARTWAAEFLGSEANREKWMDFRDSRPAISEEELEDYKNANDFDEESGNEITGADLEGVSSATAFSIYDDIKAKLLEKGIPEREIAFIHDFDTPKAKMELFGRMNRGEVRLLLGSTPKLGAGTNVQKRVVALHHIDAPWRPSDLEQREGRAVRQGNELYERDPDGFEVEILRYATEQTYDTRRWQILEHKAAGIEQLRKYGGELETEDVSSEAANAAEMKAAASGSPLILKETELRTEVRRLEALRNAHQDEQYVIKNRISYLMESVGRAPKRIAKVERALETIAKHPETKGEFTPITVDGREVKARNDAIAVLTTYVNKVIAGEEREVPVEFRGLKLKIHRASGAVYVSHDDLDNVVASYSPDYRTKQFDFSPAGLITRLENYTRDRLPGSLQQSREYVVKDEKQIAELTPRLGKTFEDQGRLDAARTEHGDVQRRLMKENIATAIRPKDREAVNRAIEERRKTLEEMGFGDALESVDSDSPRASRPADKITAGKPMGKAAVQAIATSLGSDAEVLTSPSGLPKDLSGWLAQNDPAGTARGLFDPGSGRIFVFSDRLSGDEIAAFVILHESAHRGLRRLFGPELDPVLRSIYQANANVKTRANLRRAKYKETIERATEEVIADMARQGQARTLKGWEKFVALVKKWLSERGFSFAWTDDMVEFLAGAAAEAGKSSEPTIVTEQDTDRLLSRGAQTDTPAFRKWFGDSKVVDKDGKPLVVYHGSASPKLAGSGAFKDRAGGSAGIYFSPRSETASEYANMDSSVDGDSPYLVPVYLSIQNPKYIEESYDFTPEQRDKWVRHGFDGVVGVDDTGERYEYVAFHPEQIKSAVGNVGTFDSANPDIRFSRSTDDDLTIGGRVAQLRGSGGKFTERVMDVVNSSKTFNRWHRSLGTQYHKAQVDPHFRRVFNKGQDYLGEFSRAALDAADMAPTLLPKLEGFTDIPKTLISGASREDTKKAGKAVLDGTLYDESGDPFKGKVFSDVELREQLGLNDKQVGLYREARAAIDTSLDLLHASEVAQMVRKPESIFGASLEKPKTPLPLLPRVLALARRDPGRAGEIVGDYLAEVAAAIQTQIDGMTFGGGTGSDEAAKLKAEKRRLLDLATTLVDKQNQVTELKAHGYAPLQRFGKYSVTVYSDGDNAVTGEPDLLYFSLHETQSEANAVKRQIEQDPEFAGAIVAAGIKAENGYMLYRGLTPDTLELFAHTLGVGEDSVFQTYLKVAKNSRSAFKRLVHRKAVAGFQTDLTRSLAAFVTSNARAVAGNWHMGELVEAADNIPKSKGDVKDEAVALVQYLQNPQEEAAFFRSLLFVNYLGGSLAAGLVNMTQPLTMTLPYLGQWGNAQAAKELTRAMKDSVKDPASLDKDLAAALHRGIEEGVVAPHEVHQLHAEAMRNLGSNIAVRRALTFWGSWFSATETFNRRVTFIAAYRTAKRIGAANPYQFAIKAVQETQGIYNRGNRPNWARGPIGATVLTFKQFSISYLEFLKRLPRQQQLVALAVMFLAAGLSGLPFAEDLEDLLDSIAQGLGYSWNTKQQARTALVRAVGRHGADFVMHGASHLPGVPLDVQARLGMGNLIPGSSLLKLNADTGREAADMLGPAGAFVKGIFEGGKKLAMGDFAGAAAVATPLAIKNVIKAVDMWQTGMYKNTAGAKVMDVTKGEAVLKAVGFQPTRVAKLQKRTGENMQNIGLHKVMEDSIADRLAQARFEKSTARTDGQRQAADEKAATARRDLTKWNLKNPDAKIVIEGSQITRRVSTMRQSQSERIIKRAPKEIRRDVQMELDD